MNLGFFCPKMAVSWRITVFQKLCWNPCYSVLGARAFWAKLSKRQFLDTPQKREILTDNWKVFFFLVFLCFFFTFCFFFVFLFVFFCFFVFFGFFFGGFKGQVRWPEGPPHLALNPPYLFVVFVVFVFFGGFKGQVTWPKGPPHLALNPPYLSIFVFVFVFFCSFPFFALNRKSPVFPPKKGIFLCFLCFSFFLPQPFLAFHLFNFSFSVSLSLLFFSFFLPFCLSFFAFFWFLLFLPFSFFFLLCFCFLKRATWNF